jgi:uncharacterized membrane protein YhiD involved in acid resistance
VTTGASIWLGAATGIAWGDGHFIIAGVLVVWAIIILVLFGLLESKAQPAKAD